MYIDTPTLNHSFKNYNTWGQNHKGVICRLQFIFNTQLMTTQKYLPSLVNNGNLTIIVMTVTLCRFVMPKSGQQAHMLILFADTCCVTLPKRTVLSPTSISSTIQRHYFPDKSSISVSSPADILT